LNLKPSGGKLSAFLAVSFAPFLSFLVAFFDAIVFLLCFWLSPWALTSLGANSGPLLDAPSQTGITLNKSTSVEKPSYLNLKPSGGKLSAFLAVSFAPFLSFLVAFFDAIVFLLCF
jgi:hypothetical protein